MKNYTTNSPEFHSDLDTLYDCIRFIYNAAHMGEEFEEKLHNYEPDPLAIKDLFMERLPHLFSDAMMALDRIKKLDS